MDFENGKAMDNNDDDKIVDPEASSSQLLFGSAIELLKRAPTPEYLQEWTGLLKNEKPKGADEARTSTLIFRLHHELLSFPTALFSEVTKSHTIHRIPYYSDEVILGLVNMRGQMRLCVALDKFLQIQSIAGQENAPMEHMLIIEKDAAVWVFGVHEIIGIYQVNASEIGNPPVTIAKSSVNYLKGIFAYEKKNVGLLDENLLFYGLNRCIK
jgi:chemotaxis-related protein WspD